MTRQVRKRGGWFPFSYWTAAALLIVTFASAGGYAAQHIISSLPYTASINYDTLTIAGTKVSGTGDGITITAHDVYLNLGNDTVQFGTGGGSGAHGITFTSSASNVTISGGTILHGSTSASSASGIYFGATHDILIENTDVIVYGTNGHCIGTYSVGPPGAYNIEISGGDYWNNCQAYTSRCQYDGCAIRLWSNTYGGYGDYHYSIHDITIHTSPGQGIMVQGRDQTTNAALVHIYNNEITCDARNTMYSSYSGTCYSSANPYSIALLRGAPGSTIRNNRITSGTTYGGSRGILIENCAGSLVNPIEVYDNYVDIHEGPNVEYGDGLPVHGLRIRGIDGGYNQYIQVYDNTFICTGDNLAGTLDYNSAIMPLRYSSSNSSPNISIERNLFRAKSNTSGVESHGVVFDAARGDATLVFRNNRVEGDGTLVQWGEANSGARSITLDSTTLAFLSPAYNPETYHVGYLSNSWDCSDNVARDMLYENGASDLDINFALAGTLELTLQRTITATVVGSNGFPVSSASVTIRNNYGQTVLQGVTNGLGVVRGLASYRYEQLGGADSTNFNNFTLTAVKGTDAASVSFTVTAGSAAPVVTLGNTDGDSTAVDITPPSAIDSLRAVPGSEQGSVELHWIAPGDDGTVGVADRYEIMWTELASGSVLWSADTVLNNPLPAGAEEIFTIANRPTENQFTIGVQAFDEVSNSSGISWIVALAVGDQDDGGDDNGGDDDSASSASDVISAYPNPVHFARGEYVTFTLPNEPVDLLIQTISGETVLLRAGISGEWQWFGENSSGNFVSTGVYSWFVKGTDQNGKIVVKP